MPGPIITLFVFAVVVGGITALFWPRGGILTYRQRHGRLNNRVRLEDAIKHIYTCHRDGYQCSLDSLAGRLVISRGHAALLLSRLAELKLVKTDETGPILSNEGTKTALRLVRTHRIWEKYLAERTGIPASEWHNEAERMEHALSTEEVDALDSKLGHPPWDPHGDPIPTSVGDVPPEHGISLIGAEIGRTVEIVHLEDEPSEIYDTLLNDGIVLGDRLEILSRTDLSVTVRSGGREWAIKLIAAANVTVRYLARGEYVETNRRTLCDAGPGETVRVRSISQACQGSQRRRLLDLGIVRGTDITREFTSAAGDPIAYRIRDTLIALRNAQAAFITVDQDENQYRPATA